MDEIFEERLQKYAELVVTVGLNLQPGQRLLMCDPMANNGVPLTAAPLVRCLTSVAYQAGARFVDVIWNDEQLHLLRFQHAPRDSFEEYPTWHVKTMLEYIEHGDALLLVYAANSDLLLGQDQGLVGTAQSTLWHNIHPVLDLIQRNATNWSVCTVPVSGWAAKVFPDLPAQAQEERLWERIYAACRVDQSDPIAAWRRHLDELAARCNYLNQKQYVALKFTGPGTDLVVGLPANHLWQSANMQSQSGISFVANVPSEEIFTLPHKDRVEGVVHATLPLSHGGVLLEQICLTFSQGRVVKATAATGEDLLNQLIGTDDGAGRLGEIALVPNSSPIAQSGLIFYSTAFDENAASHIALGAAYRTSLLGSNELTDEEFAAAGGNLSQIHLDLMIGSGEIDVDGVTAANLEEPLMRQGEWAFAL